MQAAAPAAGLVASVAGPLRSVEVAAAAPLEQAKDGRVEVGMPAKPLPVAGAVAEARAALDPPDRQREPAMRTGQRWCGPRSLRHVAKDLDAAQPSRGRRALNR